MNAFLCCCCRPTLIRDSTLLFSLSLGSLSTSLNVLFESSLIFVCVCSSGAKLKPESSNISLSIVSSHSSFDLVGRFKLLKLCLDLMKGISQRICSYFGSTGPTSLIPLPDFPLILYKYLEKAVRIVLYRLSASSTVIPRISAIFFQQLALTLLS